MSRGTIVWGTVVLGGHLFRGTNVEGTLVRRVTCPRGHLVGGTNVTTTRKIAPEPALFVKKNREISRIFIVEHPGIKIAF